MFWSAGGGVVVNEAATRSESETGSEVESALEAEALAAELVDVAATSESCCVGGNRCRC